MKSDAIRAYYDERYSSEWGQTFPRDPSRYRAWFGRVLSGARPHDRVLDYGCGVGYVCSLFVESGCEVTGIDLSPAALAMARDREPLATFVEPGPDGSLAFADGHFHIIACLGVLEHVPEPAPVVAELRRVARDEAVAIWVVPNARSPFFWFGHGTGQIEEHPRSLDGWRELLTENGWRIEAVRRDPGPIDRPVARWKRVGQAMLNRLPLGLTYQFVLETRPA